MVCDRCSSRSLVPPNISDQIHIKVVAPAHHLSQDLEPQEQVPLFNTCRSDFHELPSLYPLGNHPRPLVPLWYGAQALLISIIFAVMTGLSKNVFTVIYYGYSVVAGTLAASMCIQSRSICNFVH